MERPILMTTESVKAILDGRKTQTRRVIVPQPPELEDGSLLFSWRNMPEVHCPYGQVGDRLWVRETHIFEVLTEGEIPASAHYEEEEELHLLPHYKADGEDISGWSDFETGDYGGKWRPSIFMPRWASRLTLEITEVRVGRLQEITDEDCFAEGVKFSIKMKEPTAIFKDLWDSINGKKYPWSSNPWVWVIKFDNIGVRVK